MPHAWAIHTISNEYIRIGFEPSDLTRGYNDPDVLGEIEAFYRQSMVISELDMAQLTVVPIIPHTARDVVTLRDFVQVRGWYSVLDSRDRARTGAVGDSLESFASSIQANIDPGRLSLLQLTTESQLATITRQKAKIEELESLVSKLQAQLEHLQPSDADAEDQAATVADGEQHDVPSSSIDGGASESR